MAQVSTSTPALVAPGRGPVRLLLRPSVFIVRPPIVTTQPPPQPQLQQQQPPPPEAPTSPRSNIQPTVIEKASGPVIRVPFIRLPGKNVPGKEEGTTVLLLPKQLPNVSSVAPVNAQPQQQQQQQQPVQMAPPPRPSSQLRPPQSSTMTAKKRKKKKMASSGVAREPPSTSRKRNSFSVDDKIQLLDRMKVSKANRLANELSIPPSTLFAIKRNEEKIRLMHAAKSKQVKRKTCTNIYVAKLETKLIEWIRQCCQAKIELNDRKVRDRAIEMYNELPLEGDVAKPHFCGSNGWMRQFRQRAYPEIENQKMRIGLAIKQIAQKAPTPNKIFRQTVKLLLDQEIIALKPSISKGLWKELLANNGQLDPSRARLAKNLSVSKKKASRPKKPRASELTIQPEVGQEATSRPTTTTTMASITSSNAAETMNGIIALKENITTEIIEITTTTTSHLGTDYFNNPSNLVGI